MRTARLFAALTTVSLMLGGVAQAQVAPGAAPAARTSEKGHIQFNAESASGNVTSQSFGGEVAVTVIPHVQVFAEFGQVRDSAPSSIGAAAQVIAGYISRTQSNVGFSVKQPLTIGIGGVRYVFDAVAAGVEPYVVAGGGIAQVKRDITFSVGGTDVTGNMSQYGVVLGSDLAQSTESKTMFMVGGGVAWPIMQRLVVDLHYRYGRISTDTPTTLSRAGAGVGIRF